MANKPVKHILSYQTRLPASPVVDAALSAYAVLYGSTERKLFAAIVANDTDPNTLKRELTRSAGLTARQFNAIRAGLDGKISSIKERRPDLIREGEQKLVRAEKVITKIRAQLATLRDPQSALKAGKTVAVLSDTQRQAALQKSRFKLHQKQRRLVTNRARLAAMKADHNAGHVRLCFGSKKLFRAQFALADNGYASHEAWQQEWQLARSSQFLVLGSKDETAGCQGCAATLDANGKLRLRLRLPDALVTEHGAYLDLPDIEFTHGQDQIVAALQSSVRVKRQLENGRTKATRDGTAISYRFQRDQKGWRVFASVEMRPPEQRTTPLAGAIGVDVNASHVDIAETDRFGNWIDSWRIDLPAYGTSPDQLKAAIGDMAKELAAKAASSGKPVVHEKLDFARRKAELEGSTPKQARMLSSFAYGAVLKGIDAACFKAGVAVQEVNPAFTSTIGAINFAQRLGISTHQAAALAIARRGLGLSESPVAAVKRAAVTYLPGTSKRQAKAPTEKWVTAPSRDGGHVTLGLPERNRTRHEWTQWSSVRKTLGVAHAARYRSGNFAREKPAPLSHLNPTLSANRSPPAKIWHTNRQEHCSPDVLGDIPW